MKKRHPLAIKKFIIFLVMVVILGIVFIILSELKPVTESKKNDVAKIPKEIKKKLINASPSASFRVPILLYHYVEYIKDKKDTTRELLDIHPKIFDEQLKTLSDAGYTFMTVSDVADVLNDKIPLPPKPVVLTFDDGHWDLYTDILPILQKYHAKATAYIVSGFIDKSDFLSSIQLKKVIDSGLVEIGAHTVHHTGLANKLIATVKYEVGASKQQLEDTYHLHIVSFAYPGGSFDQKAIDVVKDSGYETAVSTVPGIQQSQNNKYFLYRIRPGNRTGDVLLKFLEQEHIGLK